MEERITKRRESYVPPFVEQISITNDMIVCQSGEAPDMQEGWVVDF